MKFIISNFRLIVRDLEENEIRNFPLTREESHQVVEYISKYGQEGEWDDGGTVQINLATTIMTSRGLDVPLEEGFYWDIDWNASEEEEG